MGSTTQGPIWAIGATGYTIPGGSVPPRAALWKRKARLNLSAQTGFLVMNDNPGPCQGLTGSNPREGLAPMVATTRESGGCFAQFTVPCPCLPTVLGGW